MALTHKQERFVEEYLVDLNAARAAVRAGYSKKTANKIGYNNLQNPDIQAGIEEGRKALSERTNITQDRIMGELAKVGFSDLTQALTPHGTLLHPEDWGEEVKGFVKTVKVKKQPSGEYDEDGKPILVDVQEIQAWDKLSALEKMGKHLGMFKDQVEHTGPNGGPIEVEEVSNLEVARRLAFLLASGIEEQKK